jgi:hypothetical protein
MSRNEALQAVFVIFCRNGATQSSKTGRSCECRKWKARRLARKVWRGVSVVLGVC